MLFSLSIQTRARGETALATEILSPTTGVVIEVKVSPGDRVTTDDELVIIESMKMHIPVTAPEDGVVESIRVGEGDQVNEDDLVATLT
jgi:acetyl-CoA carboxylase biotin carboxyl carrier protein